MGDLSRESVAKAIEEQNAPKPVAVGEKGDFLKASFKRAHDFVEGVQAMGRELGQRLDAVKDRSTNGYNGLGEVTNDRVEKAVGNTPPPSGPGR